MTNKKKSSKNFSENFKDMNLATILPMVAFGAVGAYFLGRYLLSPRRPNMGMERFAGMGSAPGSDEEASLSKNEKNWSEGRHDAVDEASDESFPASDAPSW